MISSLNRDEKIEDLWRDNIGFRRFAREVFGEPKISRFTEHPFVSPSQLFRGGAFVFAKGSQTAED